MHTTATAPKGYTGPVHLTAAQRERGQKMHNAWVDTLVAQANDDGDPETRDHARLLLSRIAA